MSRIWIVGEALIDRIPTPEGDYLNVVGGGPANTAKALARLGHQTCFIGGISSDTHGSAIEKELTDSGVDFSFVHRSKLPTALATVAMQNDGSARYTFQLENTATFDFHQSWLPTEEPDAIHIGSLATIIEPGASSLLEWISSKSAPIVFDPNIRPSIQSDKDLYRMTVDRWIERASIIKLSEDDLSWLYGDDSVIQNWLERGVSLVVTTMGGRGIRARSLDARVEVPARAITVVDTVGAGDTVGAIVLEGLIRHGLTELNKANLTSILYRATHAASITCSRAGANPPWCHELDVENIS